MMRIKILTALLLISLYSNGQRYLDERLYAGVSLINLGHTILSHTKGFKGDEATAFNINLRHRVSNSFSIGAEYFRFNSFNKPSGLAGSSANRITLNLTGTSYLAKWFFVEYGGSFSYYQSLFVRHYSVVDGFDNTYHYRYQKILSSGLIGFLYSPNIQVKRFVLRAEVCIGIPLSYNNLRFYEAPGLSISKIGRLYSTQDIKLSYSLFHNRSAKDAYHLVKAR